MPVSKIDKLIATEAGLPTYVHLTQERLNGKVFGAYLFNGNLLWHPTIGSDSADPLPPGSRPLYVQVTDRG